MQTRMRHRSWYVEGFNSINLILMSLHSSPDLAQHCRLLLHDHPRFPRLVRMLFLYPLYVLSELAIISTDLAELLGSAIGLVLLFPKLPLPVAVLLTATDVVFILALGDSNKNKGRPVRIFEFIIIALVSLLLERFSVPIWRFPFPHISPCTLGAQIPSFNQGSLDSCIHAC